MSTASDKRKVWRERQRQSRRERGVIKGCQRCGTCREFGHNARTCPLTDITFLIIHDQKRDKR